MLAVLGCATLFEKPYPFDFEKFEDRPIPDGVLVWLRGGEQTEPTPLIRAEAENIEGRNRRERLFRAMRYIWREFSYDPWLNSRMFERSAHELFESRSLGGCSDYATVEIALFRALGIPCRLVLTANVEWIEKYREDDLAITTGHNYIEVYLEDGWHLVDPTFRYFYEEYDPRARYLPRKQYFVRRGLDFWDMGIREAGSFSALLRGVAVSWQGDYREPGYERLPI